MRPLRLGRRHPGTKGRLVDDLDTDLHNADICIRAPKGTRNPFPAKGTRSLSTKFRKSRQLSSLQLKCLRIIED